MSKDDLKAVAEIAREKDLWVLSDEIYRHLLYEGEFHSIASLPDMLERTLILDGFSKSYAMTGWRLGYVVCPPEIAELITRLVINSTSCTASFVQRAGLAALEGPQESVHWMAEAFRRRRDLMVQGLNRIPGWRCNTPPGAFYVFPNIRGSGLTSQQMADYILEKANVAVLPGNGFGERGEGYLRLCYANSEANLQKALERIAEAVSQL